MSDFDKVKEILARFYSLDKNKTYIFGSRSNNTHRKDSDLDIFIEDNSIGASDVAKINEAFDESDLLYKVDIVLKSRIDDDFYTKILPDLKPL